MKHLKTYEQNNGDDLQIDDYVVCKENEGISKDISDFTSNNVGQFIENMISYDVPYYIVAYENVPKEIMHYFSDGSSLSHLGRRMYISEIIYFSKNKLDCETYISASKYNL